MSGRVVRSICIQQNEKSSNSRLRTEGEAPNPLPTANSLCPHSQFLHSLFRNFPCSSVHFRGHFTCLFAAATVLFLSWQSSPVRAQQVTSTVPGYRVGDSFHEMFGLHWGFSRSGPGGGVFFDNGGFGGATPAFGGFDPNSAARFGFARGGTNGGFFLDFIASQGSNRSIVSQSPILTLPNGGAGAFYNSSLTPWWVRVRLKSVCRACGKATGAAPVIPTPRLLLRRPRMPTQLLHRLLQKRQAKKLMRRPRILASRTKASVLLVRLEFTRRNH